MKLSHRSNRVIGVLKLDSVNKTQTGCSYYDGKHILIRYVTFRKLYSGLYFGIWEIIDMKIRCIFNSAILKLSYYDEV